jgi:hypothetical protein
MAMDGDGDYTTYTAPAPPGQPAGAPVTP